MRVVIFGGNSAIGAALCAHYLAQQAQVTVFSRTPLPDTLQHTLEHAALDCVLYQTVALEQADSALDARITAVFSQPVDLVFCCIGMLHDSNLQPEKSLRQLSAAGLRHSLEINTILPALWLHKIWPLLAGSPQVKLCWMSAKVGSITDNQSGGWYSYRTSKAALNMLVRTASIELKRQLPAAILVALHPGTTDTAMSKPFQRNLPAGQLQQPVDTARRLAATVAALTPTQTGALLHWDGTVLPY